MDIRTCLFCMCLIVHNGTATSLSLSCITGVIEVVEGRQNSVTCSGLLVQDTVMWVLLGQNNRKILLGYCPRPSATGVSMCSETNLEQMTPSRTSDTESVLAIDFSTLDDVIMGTLMCQIYGASTNAMCQIDVVLRSFPRMIRLCDCKCCLCCGREKTFTAPAYPLDPPEGTCSIMVSKDLSPWNVTGHCNITKTLSLLGRYTCQWYEVREESEEKLGSVVTMKTWTTQSGGKYVSGYCEMPENIKFPTTTGLVTYKVAFTPGTNITTTVSGIKTVDPPEGTCSVQVSKDLSPWNVTGHCNITKTLSLLGKYTCQWYEVREESEEKLGSMVTMKTWTTHSGGKYVSGYCEMPENIKFPTTTGLVTDKVAFTPGTNITTTVSGIKTVVRPSPPTLPV